MSGLNEKVGWRSFETSDYFIVASAVYSQHTSFWRTIVHSGSRVFQKVLAMPKEKNLAENLYCSNTQIFLIELEKYIDIFLLL